MAHLYNDQLTAHEEVLGFQKVYILNPNAHFVANPNMIPAVIYDLGPGDVIIKFNDPISGGVDYSHQKFGTYGSIGQAEWLPVCVSFPNPSIAITAARTNYAGTPTAVQQINVHPPTLLLRCPTCTSKFDAMVYYLPIHSAQTCPSCNKADDVNRFVICDF